MDNITANSCIQLEPRTPLESQIISHILACIDTGWTFVHQKGAAEQTFLDVRDSLEDSRELPAADQRIELLKSGLTQLVESGWNHVHVMFASKNVQNTFAGAKEFLLEQGIPVTIQGQRKNTLGI